MLGEIKHIILAICVLLAMPTGTLEAKVKAPKESKKEVKEQISAEQQQQFSYYWYAARQAITEERFADAYCLLQFCNAIKPDDGQTLTFLGMIFESMGKKDQAMEAYKAAYEADPEHQWRNYLEPMVKEYVQRKEYQKALATQDEIDRRSGTYDAVSAVSRCYIYSEWGKPKKAVKAIDTYLKTDSTNIRMLFLRVDLAQQMKAKSAELCRLYDRILAIDPYNIPVLNEYAWTLAEEGKDLKKAEQMSAITIGEYPNNPMFLDTYGWIMHLMGQDELAIFYLKKALWNVSADDKAVKEVVEGHIEKVRTAALKDRPNAYKTAPKALKE